MAPSARTAETLCPCATAKRKSNLRVLSFDPGAERCGWAVIDRGEGNVLTYVASGIICTPRDGEAFQRYRLRLIGNVQIEVLRLVMTYDPTIVANEIVPPVTATQGGGGTFSSNGVQAQLAATAVTTLQAVAIGLEMPVVQVSAVTVKSKVGGHKSASKVKVRNGVFERFPEIKDDKWAEWVKVHDESDACGVGIVALFTSVGDSRLLQ